MLLIRISAHVVFVYAATEVPSMVVLLFEESSQNLKYLLSLRQKTNLLPIIISTFPVMYLIVVRSWEQFLTFVQGKMRVELLLLTAYRFLKMIENRLKAELNSNYKSLNQWKQVTGSYWQMQSKLYYFSTEDGKSVLYTTSNFSKLLPIIEFHRLKLSAKIKACYYNSFCLLQFGMIS